MTASSVRRFSLAALPATPWKNGGGVTREIAAMPPGAGIADFDWRVSVADIAADGPFSAFPGIDRQIVLLEGAGVRLRAADGGFEHCLDRVGAPFAFAGEAAVDATLIDGATRDFNVMTRRGRVRAHVASLEAPARVAGATQALVLLVIAGAWNVDVDAPAIALREGDGLVLGPGLAVALTPASPAAHCLIVTLDSDATP